LKYLRSLMIAISLSVGSVSTVTAQDFNKGLKAYNAGDYQTALQEWRPLAEQGNLDAQTNLGLMYYKGMSVPQDYAEALKWYRLAAEQGVAVAQKNLGYLYDRGIGVSHDYAEALKWYRLAAEQGNSDAQTNLGVMYYNGNGVLQSNVMAHMWYNIASANGELVASSLRDERTGFMTPTDISKAQELARECINSDYQNCGY
jgi:TPR repeat protein